MGAGPRHAPPAAWRSGCMLLPPASAQTTGAAHTAAAAAAAARRRSLECALGCNPASVLVLEKLLALARGLGDAASAAHLARLIAGLEPGHPAAKLLQRQRQGQGQPGQAADPWAQAGGERPSSSDQSSQDAYWAGAGEEEGEEVEAVWGPRTKRLKTEQAQQEAATQVRWEPRRCEARCCCLPCEHRTICAAAQARGAGVRAPTPCPAPLQVGQPLVVSPRTGSELLAWLVARLSEDGSSASSSRAPPGAPAAAPAPAAAGSGGAPQEQPPSGEQPAAAAEAAAGPAAPASVALFGRAVSVVFKRRAAAGQVPDAAAAAQPAADAPGPEGAVPAAAAALAAEQGAAEGAAEAGAAPEQQREQQPEQPQGQEQAQGHDEQQPGREEQQQQAQQQAQAQRQRISRRLLNAARQEEQEPMSATQQALLSICQVRGGRR